MLNQPNLYSKYNSMQTGDATFVKKQYFPHIQWLNQENEEALDIGCGSGEISVQIILKNLPESFRKLICIDINDNMLNFAKDHHKNSRIRFEKFDIGSSMVSLNYKERFTQIFSFNCLHWVYNQRNVFNNIWKMLKPNGGALLCFLAEHPFMEVNEIVLKNDKWKKYQNNLNTRTFVNQNLINLQEDLKELLNEIGFDVRICKIEDRICEFSGEDQLRNVLGAGNPACKTMTRNDLDDFFMDFMSLLKDYATVENNKIIIKYNVFIVYVIKKM